MKPNLDTAFAKLRDRMAEEYYLKWVCGDKPSFRDGMDACFPAMKRLVEASKAHLDKVQQAAPHHAILDPELIAMREALAEFYKWLEGEK